MREKERERVNRTEDGDLSGTPARTYLLIADVLQRVGHHRDAHVDQVGRGDFEHLLGELLPVLVDFLDRHRAHDGTLVAFQGNQCNMLDFRFGLAEELLARRQQHVLVLALDFDLGNAGHGNWHTLAGVHGWTFHLQCHRVEGDSKNNAVNITITACG